MKLIFLSSWGTALITAPMRENAFINRSVIVFPSNVIPIGRRTIIRFHKRLSSYRTIAVCMRPRTVYLPFSHKEKPRENFQASMSCSLCWSLVNWYSKHTTRSHITRSSDVTSLAPGSEITDNNIVYPLLVQCINKENIKDPHCWLFVMKTHRWSVGFSHQKPKIRRTFQCHDANIYIWVILNYPTC